MSKADAMSQTDTVTDACSNCSRVTDNAETRSTNASCVTYTGSYDGLGFRQFRHPGLQRQLRDLHQLLQGLGFRQRPTQLLQHQHRDQCQLQQRQGFQHLPDPQLQHHCQRVQELRQPRIQIHSWCQPRFQRVQELRQHHIQLHSQCYPPLPMSPGATPAPYPVP
ncbi:hypothetical protein MRX96_008839 [Rhipicephalus microplus]